MTIKYIGITGKARSGKDTLASKMGEIFKAEPYKGKTNWVIERLAKPLYDIAAMWIGSPVDDTFKTDIEPVTGVTGRVFLQKLGTEGFRKLFGDDVWCKHLENRVIQKIKKHQAEESNVIVIVPDVRFNNEAKFIKDRGGLIIRVLRPGSPLKLKGNEAFHASEAGVSDNLVDVKWLNEEGKLDILDKFANNIIREVML